MKKSNFFGRVYEVVRKIPEGMVTTYGRVALQVRSGPNGCRINISPRTVGWALHALRQAQGKPNVPCHRVVNKDGRLAPGYAFGGSGEQRARLLAEGVEFIDETHVDLQKCLWNGVR
jgi:methylated-DNA-protein-cysteine methyltransferase-like protein